MKLYKRGDTYYIRDRKDGKDIKEKIGKDKRTAELVLKNLERERAIQEASGKEWTGLEELARRSTVRTFAEAAQDYLDEHDLKKSSICDHRAKLNKYLLPEFGHIHLNKIEDHHLRNFQQKISAGISARRVNSVMSFMGSILQDALIRGEITRNPKIAVRRKQESKTKVDPLSRDDLSLALSSIDPHYRPLFTTLAYTGARPNELIALRWSDIDWVNEAIDINKGRVRGEEGLPKTVSSERLIPMLPPVRKVLQELKNSHTVAIDNYVFVNKKGNPIDKHLDRIWARALKKAGLRHRPSYQLRHTFATQLLTDGFPVNYVARLLGHSTIDVTIRHYSRWIDEVSQHYDAKLKSLYSETGTLSGTSATQQNQQRA